MAKDVKRAPQKVSLERANPFVAVGHGYYEFLIDLKQKLNWGKDLRGMDLDLLSRGYFS